MELHKKYERLTSNGLGATTGNGHTGTANFDETNGGHLEMISKVDIGFKGKLEEKFHRFSIEETRSNQHA